MRTSRRFQPEVLGLEGRQLLSGARARSNPTNPYPVGPPLVVPFGGVGSKPNDGTIYSVVGGTTSVLVTASSGHQFKAVRYVVADGLIADSASYSDTGGRVRRMLFPVTHTFQNLTRTDSFQWDWDGTPGVHAVVVTAVYENGDSEMTVVKINVEAPTVDSMSVNGRGLQFGVFDANLVSTVPAKGTQVGFAQDDAEAEFFLAHVHNTTIMPGKFSFVETVAADLSFRYSNGYARSFHSLVWSLYRPGDFRFGPSVEVAPGQEGWLPPDGYVHQVTGRDGKTHTSKLISDSPSYTRTPSPPGSGWWLQEVHMLYQFRTQLVWEPTVGGVPVVLSSVRWTLQGDAVMKAGVQGSAAQLNPTSYTVNLGGDAPTPFWSYSGDGVRELLTYEKNISLQMGAQDFPP